jgi:diguanylate cyclase (GGDEF)-like protein/PAS domain S-box-containing protein
MKINMHEHKAEYTLIINAFFHTSSLAFFVLAAIASVDNSTRLFSAADSFILSPSQILLLALLGFLCRANVNLIASCTLTAAILIARHLLDNQDIALIDISAFTILLASIYSQEKYRPRTTLLKLAPPFTLIIIGLSLSALDIRNHTHALPPPLQNLKYYPLSAGAFIITGLAVLARNYKRINGLSYARSDLLIFLGAILTYSILFNIDQNNRHLASEKAKFIYNEIQDNYKLKEYILTRAAGNFDSNDTSDIDSLNDDFQRDSNYSSALQNIAIYSPGSNAITSTSQPHVDLSTDTPPKQLIANIIQQPATSALQFINWRTPSAEQRQTLVMRIANRQQYLLHSYSIDSLINTLTDKYSTNIQIDIFFNPLNTRKNNDSQDANLIFSQTLFPNSQNSWTVNIYRPTPGNQGIGLLLFILTILIPLTIRTSINLISLNSEQNAELIAKQSEIFNSLLASNALQERAATGERLYRSLFEENPDCILLSDEHGVILDANPAANKILNFNNSISTSTSTLQEVLPFNLSTDKNGTANKKLKRVNIELAYTDAHQKKFIFNISHFPTTLDGKYLGSFTVARDFSKFREAEQDAILKKRALDACSNGIVITDPHLPDNPIIYTNAAFQRITGYSAIDALGKNCRFLNSGIIASDEKNQLRHAIDTGIGVNVIMQNRRKDGSLFWNDLKIEPVYDEHKVLSHFVGIQTDVTAQKQNEQKLSFNASHDQLTGLPNRALLEERLLQSFTNAKRHKRLLAVLFIDLDEFKPINDSFGHIIGDEVLMEVAERLRCESRNIDTLARLGGDEYILLIPDIHSEAQAISVAERIITCIDSPFYINELELHITCSIGISFNHDETPDGKLLLQQADMAMYRAKQLGRNTYNIFTDDLDQAATSSMQLRNDLKFAIQNNQLELHYQPQVDARTGRISGMEALLRWHHPSRGLISPAEFIPMAEANGQIVPIGQWVLDSACQCINELLNLKLYNNSISVNVSAIQIQRQPFDEVVADTLQKYNLAPAHLELEITESVLLQDIERSLKILKNIKQQGVNLAIDDFGTGFSSLNYLKLMPLSMVKIDKSFITEIIHNNNDAAITNAIIAMAHSLSMTVIAEGVEEASQYNMLVNNKCDYIQGYLFSKPLTHTELITFLKQNQNGVTLPEISKDLSRTLLLVDDEPNIIRALTRTLRKDGYKILSCTNAQEGFELLALNNVHVIISDQRMPGMTGTEFLNKVKDIYPNTIRIVLSGFTDLNSVTEAINQGAIYKYLTKPWDDEKLSDTIRQAFQQYELKLNTVIRLSTDRE